MLEDQGIMTKTQNVVDKLRSDHQTESIVADLGKKGNFLTSSAKNQSERTNGDAGNIDLCELGEMSIDCSMSSVLDVLT